VAGELGPGQREYLEGMGTSARYLDRLVENLLEMGRLEEGRFSLEIADVDLREPLRQAVETVGPIARARGVRLAVEAPARTVARTDFQKTVEIAVNLLENAVRFSPDGGEVRVDLDPTLPGFSVSDQGPGLGDADPDRLFARFEQGAPSPYAADHGFGLGLHIVASYVGLLDGTVRAENRPGGGARFTVRLPASLAGEVP
jgi:signal transduction histidine kinase